MNNETADFSIVVATRRRIPESGEFAEELFVQHWQSKEVRREACRLEVPAPRRLTEDQFQESPFSCHRHAGTSAAFKRCLKTPVLCWPDLRTALELLFRFAEWLPDSQISGWDFQDLWRAAFPQERRGRLRLSQLAKHIGSTFQEPAKSRQVAALLGEGAIFLEENLGLKHLQHLVAGRQELDFERYAFGPSFLEQLPESPGIYWMADRAGNVFYVGKSKNLSRRLRSYFISSRHWDEKLTRIHQQLYSIECRAVGSELEAFLEEARAIAKWQPEINIQLEIRERGSEYYRNDDLILVMPGGKKKQLHLYFLHGGQYSGDFLYSGRLDQRRKLQERLNGLFFSGNFPPEAWETHVMQSFIRQNLETTNHIDVRLAAGAKQCVEWIEQFRKVKPGERVVFR